MPLTASCVLVPIDFSDESPRAIAKALEIAGSPSRLHLLHVMPPLETMSPGYIMGNLTDDVRRQRVTDALTRLAEASGADGATLAVAIGTPGLEIADYATQQAADLIVIPSHGYQGAKRLFLGSVAERVIRHATCNVLVVRRSDAE